MTNIISICYISGEIFQKITYEDINDLINQLNLLIKSYDSDIHIQLLINNIILNNFDIIECDILLKIYDFIIIVFSQKKDLYCF